MANSITRTLLIEEAERRHWTVEFIGHDEYFCKITDQTGHSELFRGSRPLRNSANSLVIAKHKDLTMEYVRYCGYKVPPYMVLNMADKSEQASNFLKRHAMIVVKPSDGQQSIGISTDISDDIQLSKALALARHHSRSGRVVLQKQLTGNLYRLVVINGRLVAAAWRKAPIVIGDGQRTVRELIELLNQDPRRGISNDTPLKEVKLSDAADWLSEAGLAKVPAAGEAVKVVGIDSVSTGGEAVEITQLVHEEWRKVLVDLAVPISLFICGYDVICDDISKPIQDNYLPLLEINSAPGFKLHHYPTGGGEPIDLARILLDELFDIAKSP